MIKNSSFLDYHVVADKYAELDRVAKSFGSELSSPFMTLSFMALLVIPRIKISDRGLFDVEGFRFMDLYERPVHRFTDII